MMISSQADYFKSSFFKTVISGTLSESNGLDPDQDRHCVSPDLDLDPNGLQRLSAEDKSCC